MMAKIERKLTEDFAYLWESEKYFKEQITFLGS